MTLFRCIYLREGRPAGMTFAARTPATAAEFAYTVLQAYIRSIGGGEVLTVKETKRRSGPPSLD